MDTNPQQPNGVPSNEPNEAPQFQQPQPLPQPEPVMPVAPQPVNPPVSPVFGSAPTTVIGSAAGTPEALSGSAYQAHISKPKNKLFIIIGAVVAFLLLAGVGAFFYFSTMVVTASDYAEASTQYNKVSSENSLMVSSLSALSSGKTTVSDATFETNVKNAEDAISSVKTENEALGKLKAMRVGDGKAAYDTFSSKLGTYASYSSEAVASIKAMRPAMVTCSKTSDAKDAATMVVSLKACSKALTDLEELPGAEFNTFVAALATNYGTYATTYEQRSALAKPFGADYDTYRKLTATLTTAQTAISTASSDFSDALTAKEDKIGMSEAADALRDFLNKKR